MKRFIISTLCLLMLLGLACGFAISLHPSRAFAQSLYNIEDAICFDISFGDITFTDTSYAGYDADGNVINGTHSADNIYVVQQSTTQTSHTVAVGTPTTPVTNKFEIHLKSINIDGPKTTEHHAAPIYVNTNANTVYIILDNNSNNTLTSYAQLFVSATSKTMLSEELRFGHAAIEKEIDTQGTLVVTCEEGHKLHLQGNTKGHNCTANGTCGSLSATANSDAKFNSAGNTRTAAAAAIGSKAEVSAKADKRTTLSSAPTMGKMYNLTIAGGKITAKGATGNSNNIDGVKVYLGGSPGIGVGAGLQQYSIGYAVDNLWITGGHINAIAGDGSAANIGGGYHAGYVRVSIYGGTVNATAQRTAATDIKRGPGIGGGGGGATSNATAGATVRIYGGDITATSQYGAAIGSGAGGNNGIGQTAWVYIYGGKIDARTSKGDGNGAGAAIGSGGSSGKGKGGTANIYIYDGTIFASSELGADIGGGGTQSTQSTGVGGEAIVTISGGNITAMTGGIGGGRAKTGAGGKATLTISGGVINAASVSGGQSVSGNGGNAIVDVSDGTINTGSIGGGRSSTGKIGSAAVTISGGKIHGQIIMDSTNLASGEACFFKMTGGTIDMTKPNNGHTFTFASPNGGVVHIVGASSDGSAIARVDGGVIRNSTAALGGAIYISGGGSALLSGGTIEYCAAESGGAIYVEHGDITITGGTIQHCEATNGGAVYVEGGNVTMDGGTLQHNAAKTNGGAIYLSTSSINANINIFSGSIIHNTAGKHAGAIGANAIGTYKIDVQIGLQECLGTHPHEHTSGTCPVISSNTSSDLGGALCLHGDANALTVDVYCGTLVANIAIRNPGSNTLNQRGGTVTVYAGTISPGIMVGGGIYTDTRIDAEQIILRFWSNFEGGPSDPYLVEVTIGVTVTFPVDTYTWTGHVLSGWATAPDASGLYIPAQGQHTIEDAADGYLDFYAVWDATSSFVIYIPESTPLDGTGVGTVEIDADINYFSIHSNLEVYFNSDFTLTDETGGAHISYKVTSSEFGAYHEIQNGDICATYQYNNKGSKTLHIQLLDTPSYAGTYTDNITFTIVYTEIIPEDED